MAGVIAGSSHTSTSEPLIDFQGAVQSFVRDATIATRNLRDFACTGAKLIDPWGA